MTAAAVGRLETSRARRGVVESERHANGRQGAKSKASTIKKRREGGGACFVPDIAALYTTPGPGARRTARGFQGWTPAGGGSVLCVVDPLVWPPRTLWKGELRSCGRLCDFNIRSLAKIEKAALRFALRRTQLSFFCGLFLFSCWTGAGLNEGVRVRVGRGEGWRVASSPLFGPRHQHQHHLLPPFSSPRAQLTTGPRGGARCSSLRH